MKGNVWTPELPNVDNVVGLAAAGQQDLHLFSFPDVSSGLHASEGSIYIYFCAALFSKCNPKESPFRFEDRVRVYTPELEIC